jgi:phosphoserine phosphatase
MADDLASWNDGASKSSILDFVSQVTSAGSPSFVAPGARIVTFDNDGTMWLEKPMYIQFQHGLRAVAEMAEARPEVRTRQPFKAVHEKDMAWLGKVADDYATGDPKGILVLVGGMAAAFEGITVEAFEADVSEFLATTNDDRFEVPLKELTYKPMVELVHYLQANDFQVYLASGGGRDFMRAVSEEIYRIPPSRAIGSSIATEYAEDTEGVAQVLRTKEIELPMDDGPGKPLHIHRAIGRRPIMAAGNSDGDIHMLKYATGQEGSTLGLLVHHDDAEREYAYDAGSEKALAVAATAGWTVVSMRDDWKVVFP